MGLKTNISSVRARVNRAIHDAESFHDREMEPVARSVFSKTQIKVPKDTGALTASGHVVHPKKLTWEIKYGNSNVDRVGVFYAAAVHERRATHAAPTGTKYVEEPLMESLQEWRNAARRAARRLLA